MSHAKYWETRKKGTEAEILKPERYKFDPYLQLDIALRKLSYTILNDFRSRPTEENLDKIWTILALAFRAIAGDVSIKLIGNTFTVTAPELGAVSGGEGSGEGGSDDDNDDEEATGDGCGPNEHWNGSACEPDVRD